MIGRLLEVEDFRGWCADLTDELIALRRAGLHFNDAWSLATRKYPEIAETQFRLAKKRPPGFVPSEVRRRGDDPFAGLESVENFVRRHMEAAYYREDAEKPVRRAA